MLKKAKEAETRFTEALSLSKKAAEKNGASSETLRVLSDAGMRVLPYRDMFFKMFNGFSPKENAEKAFKLDPENRKALLSLGLYYLYCPAVFGGSSEKAKEYFNQYTGRAADDLERFTGAMWQAVATLGFTEVFALMIFIIVFAETRRRKRERTAVSG